MEYLAVSPSTGMIADIFLAEIIPSRVARFLRARNSSILPPPPENKHVSHVEEEREREEKMVGMEGPKKRITLTISVAL